MRLGAGVGYYAAVLLTLVARGHLHRWLDYPLWLSLPLVVFILGVVPWFIFQATAPASSG